MVIILINNSYKVTNVQISALQFFIISILFVVGDAILYVPSLIVQGASHTIWIAGLIGIAEAVLLSLLYAVVSQQFDNKGFFPYLELTYGRWLGRVLFLLFLLYVMVDVILMIFEMGSFMVTVIMPETPLEAIIMVFLLVVIIGARLGLETLSRAAEILFPWFCVFFFLLVCLNLPNAKFENMQPFFEGGIHKIFKGNVSLASYIFESIILIVIFPHIREKDQATKAYIKGITIGVTLLVIISLLSLLVFGLSTLKMEFYPSYLLGQTLEFNFFSHVEVIMAVIWFISLFFKVAICFFVSAQGISQLIKVQDYRIVTFPIGIFLFALSFICIPSSMYLIHFINSTWLSYSVTYGLFFPLFLLAVELIRKSRKSNSVNGS